ncbi:AMP-dependent synthetase/ligase [Umezawaea sp. NPDC059074]|uniref:AMP-dependent synthetase/ligase n=1 Tax=Umezawaea sp. NPDC059074 TaxID=3346716 RepID=UPI003693E68C
MPSPLDSRPPSLAHLLHDRAAATPDAPAYRFPTPDGGWEELTWSHVLRRVSALAAGLLSLGVRSEDRVAIASATRVEWILADLATTCAGAATTAVYPSTNADETAFILGDSGSRVLFAENEAQLAKVLAERERLPDLGHVVLFEGDPVAATGLDVLSLADLEKRGIAHLAADPHAVAKTVDALEPGHLATLVYTSGTTGRPKGVRLAHDCWSYAALAQEEMGLFRAEDVHLLWLPLSHVFGKTLISGQIATGHVMAVDGRVDRVVANLTDVRPTITAAVPRILEKVHNGIVARSQAGGGLRHKVFQWAARVARAHSRAAGTASPVLRLQHAVADRLVYGKVRAAFGGRLRGALSGGVRLDPDIGHFFVGAGVPVLEAYGLTETSAGVAINRHGSARVGSAGPPFPGTEVRIAEDGEILVRGPGVMSGYHDLPESTADVLDADGWLHTGDIGDLDDGHVRVTDRKKDLFKTSGGKYVAPSAIESAFKALCPFVGNVVVVGDGRAHCTALIALDATAIMPWAAGKGVVGDYAAVVADPRTEALVRGYVDTLNTRLQRWQTVRGFALLPCDLSVEHGDLTPSLKVKRREVAALLDALYANAERP